MLQWPVLWDKSASVYTFMAVPIPTQVLQLPWEHDQKSWIEPWAVLFWGQPSMNLWEEMWSWIAGLGASDVPSLCNRKSVRFRIIELLTLQKTSEIVKPKCQPSTTTIFTSKPCPPYSHVFWTLSGMVTPPLSWAACFRVWQHFPQRIFS